ncbi:MAG: arsenite methyltransferase [Dehalococcoidia bacterium]|nr:arsenite methyltransferase [Dehalococcoidia bacterium]
MQEKDIKAVVRDRYSEIARQDRENCGCCDCGGSPLSQAQAIGYSSADLSSVPEEAVMGLGCGSPVAVADLKTGEVVLDLGSGAGVDVFLAADRVGLDGRVIGVDMTEQMVHRAEEIARTHGYRNVEFRRGEMERLPIDDESVDVILSNCVINLSPDKAGVFREAYRVLKPGGRLVISDIVSENPLPAEMKNDPDAWACCIGGALEQQEYLDTIRKAGFGDVEVTSCREFYIDSTAGPTREKLISITVKAYR